jgi:hypothetical protein
MSKRFQMVGFRGSTQEKWRSEIFRFGYGKAANDKKVPDPVGSEVREPSNDQIRELRKEKLNLTTYRLVCIGK